MPVEGAAGAAQSGGITSAQVRAVGRAAGRISSHIASGRPPCKGGARGLQSGRYQHQSVEISSNQQPYRLRSSPMQGWHERLAIRPLSAPISGNQQQSAATYRLRSSPMQGWRERLAIRPLSAPISSNQQQSAAISPQDYRKGGTRPTSVKKQEWPFPHVFVMNTTSQGSRRVSVCSVSFLARRLLGVLQRSSLGSCGQKAC
jgi:hypothetical protein